MNAARGLLIATFLSVGIWIGIGLLVCEVTHGK